MEVTIRHYTQSCWPESLKRSYRALARAYARNWGLACVLTDVRGNIVDGEMSCSDTDSVVNCASVRSRAIEEALRWGEPSMLLCPHGFVTWAVPVMRNSVVIGGLVVERAAVGTDEDVLSPSDIRRAASDLLTVAEESNLTNAALLELRRAAAERESERAEAIHELKGQDYRSIRDIYLVEEPALIAAIKRGDRPAAREILNRVLVGIYHSGRQRPAC